jgi:hypothetical protein
MTKFDIRFRRRQFSESRLKQHMNYDSLLARHKKRSRKRSKSVIIMIIMLALLLGMMIVIMKFSAIV